MHADWSRPAGSPGWSSSGLASSNGRRPRVDERSRSRPRRRARRCGRDAHVQPARQAQRAVGRVTRRDQRRSRRAWRPTTRSRPLSSPARARCSARASTSPSSRAPPKTTAFGRELWASSDRYHETVLHFLLADARGGERPRTGRRLRPRGAVRSPDRIHDRPLRPLRSAPSATSSTARCTIWSAARSPAS